MGSEHLNTMGTFRLSARQRMMLEFAYGKRKWSDNDLCHSLEIEPHEFEGELNGLTAFFGGGTLHEVAYLAKDRKYLLTAREREVLEQISFGYSSKEAADNLFVSKRTIDFHLANIYAYLGADNRTQAARIARSRGLIRSDEELHSELASQPEQSTHSRSASATGVPALRIAAA